MSTGEQLRDEGMARALSRDINREWKRAFVDAYCQAVMDGHPFTAADLLEVSGMPPGSPNVIGAWFHSILKPDLDSGLVVYLRMVRSTRPSRHANHLGLYQARTGRGKT